MVERIQSPWIQPCGRRDRDEDPPRLGALPFACAVAFFARSKAAVFSFTIVANERGSGAGQLTSAADESGDEGGENEEALFGKPPPGSLYGVTSEWLTGRPGRPCQIP